MIIKVPIYVELDAIDPDFLAPLVDALAKHFYLILRKENLNKKVAADKEHSVLLGDLTNAKVISKDKALESLRTKK